MAGELDAGNPHVQFDEGAQETCDSATRLCPTLPKPLASWTVYIGHYPWLRGNTHPIQRVQSHLPRCGPLHDVVNDSPAVTIKRI